ncbi:MAG: hypothetical protein ACI7YS_15595 [Flavobacterium sp.]
MHLTTKLHKVAIVITFNDIQKYTGGSRAGLKEKISYFDQFLILYESICTTWKKEKFDYEFHILHSIPFTKKKQRILENLRGGVTVKMVTYPPHRDKIRPMAYYLDVDCDYKLVLDVDMLALKEPDFDFSVDAQAMYGGNKYNPNQWQKVCEHLNCDFPKDLIIKQDEGHYREFGIKEYFLYHTDPNCPKMFPYFNNGAIFIRNSLSKELAKVWEGYRASYTEFVKKEFNTNIDLEGQDVMGLAIHNVAKEWLPFQRGFNFILQEKFEDGVAILRNHEDQAVLLHYINVPKESTFYGAILNGYKEVQRKYYSLPDRIIERAKQYLYSSFLKNKRKLSKIKKQIVKA